ncbi:unnamed protein product [Clavelina lepadiformis]|uniref:Methyltransferase domain-containing protein n=1 Tax=Clavelina lepadiformis TaxID=159417 RepID=A0ABP0FJV4_CLALP
MQDDKMETALNSVKNVLFCNTLEKSQEAYTNWSDGYDSELGSLHYQLPQHSAKMFAKYVKNSKTVLDAGAGTGKVAQELREKHGYEGILDLLDANLDMLALADKKGLQIRNIIRHWINETGELPVKNENYDVIMCVGSFIPNHIPASALKGMLNSLKRDGWMIFTTRTSTTDSYKTELEDVIQDLIDRRAIELVEKEEHLHFPNASKEIFSAVFVVRKL